MKTIQSKRISGNLVKGIGFFPYKEPKSLKNEDADQLLTQFAQDFEEVVKKESPPPTPPKADKKESEGSK